MAGSQSLQAARRIFCCTTPHSAMPGSPTPQPPATLAPPSRPKSARLPMRPQTAPRPTNAHQQEQIWMRARQRQTFRACTQSFGWSLQSYVDFALLRIGNFCAQCNQEGRKASTRGAKLMTIGVGIVEKLRQERQEALDSLAKSEARVDQLEAEKSKLSHQLDSSYDQLKVLMVESGALQSAMELDRAMSARDGPIRLSGNMIGTMWKHMNFSVIKRERDRHLEETRRLNEVLEQQKKELETDKRLLKMELRKLEKEHTSALEVIDCLRLNTKSVKLTGQEQQHIKQSWDSATGPRPWADETPAKGDEDPWSFSSWLEPLGLPSIMSDSFERMMSDKGCPTNLQDTEGKKAFLYALAQHGSADTIRAMLRAAPLLEKLTETIWSAIRDFKTQCDSLAEGKARAREIEAAVAAEEAAEQEAALTSGVVQEIDFDNPETFAKEQAARLLVYGPPPLFHSSLRDIVGSPASDGLSAMAREHTVQADSDVEFVAPNYDIRTTSKVEWYIVADPDKALPCLGLDDWPMGGGHTPLELGFRHINSPTGEHFTPKIAAVNEQLRRAGDVQPLTLEHFCALRMYTGPIYIKYNFILRGGHKSLSNKFINEYVRVNCKNNTYPTTMLYLCLGITKLSRITKAQKVYRAPGGRLPKEFFEETAGARGGIELGFMSTTVDKHEAMKYAAYSGCALIFEVQQGMVSKGADIAWLSQFPAEAEVLFAPMTVCEVHQIRCEGAFQVVELRPSTSSMAKWSEMELFAEERMAGILKMLRRNPDSLAKIDGAVVSSGGLAADAPAPDSQLGRAKAYCTTIATLAKTFTELEQSYAQDAVEAEERAQEAEMANSTDLEPRAFADRAKAMSRAAAIELKRYSNSLTTAQMDRDGVETLVSAPKEVDPEEITARSERARARWKNKIKDVQGANVIALMATLRKELKRKKESQARVSYP